MRSAWASRLAKAEKIKRQVQRDNRDEELYRRYRTMRDNGYTLERCALQLDKTPRDLRQLIARVLGRRHT
jgi:hypothetical protein